MAVSAQNSRVYFTTSEATLNANGQDTVTLFAELNDEDNVAIVGEQVRFNIIPFEPDDSITYTDGDHSLTDGTGTASADYTTQFASIKLVEVLVGEGSVLLEGVFLKVEFVQAGPTFLVTDPFSTNGSLGSDITLAGKRLSLVAETDNSGAITELYWDGTQLLNSLNKSRMLQDQLAFDNFDTEDYSQVNHAGALSELWGDSSSSRYIGDVTNTRQFLTQSFMAYDVPLNYDSVVLDCSGNILSKQFYVDFLGNPGIVKVDTRLDQFASTKRGAMNWGLNLSLIQDFTRAYTYQPSVDNNPIEVLTSGSSGEFVTAYTGGMIVSNVGGTLAVGVYRIPQGTDRIYKTVIVKPGAPEGGDPKFTDNHCQFLDIEAATEGSGSAAGAHHSDRFLCFGTFGEVQAAFDQLSEYFDQAVNGSEGAVLIQVQSSPAAVQRFELFNITVAAIDADGQLDTEYDAPVTVSINSGQGTISGQTTVQFVNGVANFTNLSLDEAGVKTLFFSSGFISGSTAIVVENLTPFITTLNPNTITDNTQANVVFGLLGLNFLPETVVRVGPYIPPVQYLSSTALRFTLTPTQIFEGNFRVTATNPAPGGGTSNLVFLTVTDGTPPIISNVDLNVSGQQVAISWNTDEPATTEFRYVDPDGSTVILDENPLTADQQAHNIVISGLAVGDYTGTIRAEDEEGNRNDAGETVSWSIGDNTPPVISALQFSNITATSAQVSWTTDEPTRHTLTVTDGSNPIIITDNTLDTTHSEVVSGLVPETQYTATVVASDAANPPNTAQRSDVFTTNDQPDTEPPIITSGPTVTSLTNFSARIVWQTNEDATSIVRYGTSPGNYTNTASTPGDTQNHSVLLTGLSPDTAYFFIVTGEDPAMNVYSSVEQGFSTFPLSQGDDDLQDGDNVAFLEVYRPDGKADGETYMVHSTIPIKKASDLNLEWEAVNGSNPIVQRTVVTYKPTPEVVTSAGAFIEQDGLVVVEFENVFNNTPDWALHTANPALNNSYTGAGYIEWEGPDYFDESFAGQFGLFSVNIEISTPGTYDLFLRNTHQDLDPTEENDVWVRVASDVIGPGGGDWQKVFSNSPTSVEDWVFESQFDQNPSFPQASYELTAGVHTIEFSGRSNGFKMDRFHLALATNPNATNPNVPQSFQQTNELPSGPNSVEIIFPCVIPVGLEVGDPFEVEIRATASSPGPDLVDIIPTSGLLSTLHVTHGGHANHTVDLLLPNNARVFKQGEHCLQYGYFNRFNDGANDSICVYTYVTQYDQTIDDNLYVQCWFTNSFADPTAPAPTPGVTGYDISGKVYFDEWSVDSSGAGGYDIHPRWERAFGTEIVSPTQYNIAAYATDPNEGFQVNGNGTFSLTNRSFPGNPARQEVFHNQQNRVEHFILTPTGNTDLVYGRDVSEFKNVALARSGRNSPKTLRWFGPCYYRSGTLADSYASNSRFDARTGVEEVSGSGFVPALGRFGFDEQRNRNTAESIKWILENQILPFGGSPVPSMKLGGIIASEWRPVHDKGCWTPGFSSKGTQGGIFFMNINEMEPGRYAASGWSYWVDQLLQRHWFACCHGNGEPVSAEDWLAGNGGQALPFIARNQTNDAGFGDVIFWGLDTNGSWGKQGESFRQAPLAQLPEFNESGSNCTYSGNWYFQEPIGSSHIQRVLRCYWGLTNTLYCPMYEDMLRHLGERYLLAETRHQSNDPDPPSRNLSVREILDTYSDPSTQGKCSWVGGAPYGRNKGWATFTISLYNMYLSPGEQYASGGDKRQNIQEHLDGWFDALSLIMPGGTTPTYQNANTTGVNFRVPQANRFSSTAFASGKEDIGASEYSFTNNSGPFSSGVVVTSSSQTNFEPSGGPNNDVAVVRPDNSQETSGTIFIDVGSGQPYNLPITGDIVAQNQTIGTITLTGFIRNLQNDYSQYQRMEQYIQQQSWYAAATALRPNNPYAHNVACTWLYEAVLALHNKPNYYRTTEFDGQVLEFVGGYPTVGNSALLTGDVGSVLNPGSPPILVNEFLQEEPELPFVGEYVSDVENTHPFQAFTCAAYAADEIGIEPLSLNSVGMKELFKSGVFLPGADQITNPTPQDWEDKLSLFALASSKGSSMNVNERWYHYGMADGEIRHQLTLPQPVTLKWTQTSVTISETFGTLNILRVITENGAVTSEDVDFELTVGGTAPAADYDVDLGPHTLLAGENFVDIPVTLNDNTDADGLRTIELTINSLNPLASVDPFDTVTINVQDNDTAVTPTIEFNTEDTTIFEGSGDLFVSLKSDTILTSAVDVTVSITGTATVDTDYTLSNITNQSGSLYTVSFLAGASSSGFFITAIDDGSVDPSEEIVINIIAGAGYNLGADTQTRVTIEDLPNQTEGQIFWEGFNTLDGVPNTNNTRNHNIQVSVPVIPPALTAPEYVLEDSDNPGSFWSTQVIPVDKTPDGLIKSVQVIGRINRDQRLWSVPGDANNPAIKLHKQGGGVPHPEVTTFAANLFDNHTIEIKLANVATPYVFRPDSNLKEEGLLSKTDVFDGIYARRTIYKGRFVNPDIANFADRTREDECLVVKVCVDERSDNFSYDITVIVENSAISPTEDTYDINSQADGVVYFEYIKYKVNSSSEDIVTPFARETFIEVPGTNREEWYLVAPQDLVADQGADQMHAMLPGQMFMRRLMTHRTLLNSSVEKIGAGSNYGFVDGPIGYQSGGYGEINMSLPSMLNSDASYGGETEGRAFVVHSQDATDLVFAELLSGTLPDGKKNWGWFKGTEPIDPQGFGDTSFNPFGTETFLFRSMGANQIELERHMERYGLATFSLDTQRPMSEEELAVAPAVGTSSASVPNDQLPYGFSSVENPAAYPLCWLSTGFSGISNVTTTGNWNLAPTDLPWNAPDPGKSVFYMEEEGKANWQTNANHEWGPYTPEASHRMLQAIRAGIYLYNNYGAKVLLEHLAAATMFQYSRYQEVAGSSSTKRINYTHDATNLKWLFDNENNYANSNQFNKGVIRDRSGSVQGDLNSPRQWANPTTAIAMHLAVSDTAERARITDANNTGTDSRNWPYLMSTLLDRMVAGSVGLFTASRFSRDDLVVYGDITDTDPDNDTPNFFNKTGPMPGAYGSGRGGNNTLNNTNGFFSAYCPGEDLYHAAALSMAGINMLDFPGVSTIPYRLSANFAGTWSRAGEAFVQEDETLNPSRRGLWLPTLGVAVNTGTQSVNNPVMSPSAALRGDQIWKFDTPFEATNRADDVFMFCTLPYVSLAGSFGPTATGIKWNMSYDGVSDVFIRGQVNTEFLDGFLSLDKNQSGKLYGALYAEMDRLRFGIA